MTFQEIQDRFRKLGYNPDGLTMKEIVRFMQVLEHNRPCFGRYPSADCPHKDCWWRESCLGVVPEVVWVVVDPDSLEDHSSSFLNSTKGFLTSLFAV